jgi:nitric oxide reductase subunit B
MRHREEFEMTSQAATSAGIPDDPVSKVLKWVLLAVAGVTFVVLGWATTRTYALAPPIPARFLAPDGTVVLTEGDIVQGKAGFQRADLMDYGSLYGMGSYFGEDYTASELVRLAKLTEGNIALNRFGKPFSALEPERQAAVQVAMQHQLQGIDLTGSIVRLPTEVASAMTTLRGEIAASLLQSDYAKGWTEAHSLNPGTAAQTAGFLIYSSLTTVARRPGGGASWTQNWPYEPLVGNTPTVDNFVWTWISFCFTFFAFGAVIFLYERFIHTPDHGTLEPPLPFRPLTESQRRVGKYFVVVAAVLLLQILAGSILAHYYSDRASFYGIPVDRFLPFNFLRDVHIQSPIVWIGLSWIGAGLFLAPTISRAEPKGQAWLVDALFWVTLAIVVGAFAGNYLDIMGHVHDGWFWLGQQGLSYIQLGRAWQIGFFAGLAIWSVLVFRALWPDRAAVGSATRAFWSGRIRMEHLLWASTANIALLYTFGMIPLTGIEKSFTIADFWRWWVVHLWVEQSFEFFAAVVSAYLLTATGLVSRQLAERAVYLELILIFLGGVLGTGHHLYWVGGPGLWLPVGSMFSFIEVLPLLLLVIEAVQQHRLIVAAAGEFKYGLAYLYILGAAFWNFVGAGVFGGGTLNAPLVNYYEHGTFLTLNHAHTALFGAFGLLGIGLVYFCLRYAAGERHAFSERAGRWAFWLYNSGLVLWIVLNFFPIGWPQLAAVYEHGFAYARSQAFYQTTMLWQWMRMPGDIVFALGALFMAWDFLVKLPPLLRRSAAPPRAGAGALPRELPEEAG